MYCLLHLLEAILKMWNGELWKLTKGVGERSDCRNSVLRTKSFYPELEISAILNDSSQEEHNDQNMWSFFWWKNLRQTCKLPFYCRDSLGRLTATTPLVSYPANTPGRIEGQLALLSTGKDKLCPICAFFKMTLCAPRFPEQWEVPEATLQDLVSFGWESTGDLRCLCNIGITYKYTHKG